MLCTQSFSHKETQNFAYLKGPASGFQTFHRSWVCIFQSGDYEFKKENFRVQGKRKVSYNKNAENMQHACKQGYHSDRGKLDTQFPDFKLHDPDIWFKIM